NAWNSTTDLQNRQGFLVRQPAKRLSSTGMVVELNSFGEMFNQKIMEYTDDIGVIAGRMELEEPTCLTSGYTTKLQSSRQYSTGTKTEIQINGTKWKALR
ncbi:hypothetical protein X798_07117, partial [Onchocerca flexuosa]